METNGESLAHTIVHWPGQDTPACLKHAEKLVRLGEVMGVRVSVSQLLQDPDDDTGPVLCANCVNEQQRTDHDRNIKPGA